MTTALQLAAAGRYANDANYLGQLFRRCENSILQMAHDIPTKIGRTRNEHRLTDSLSWGLISPKLLPLQAASRCHRLG